MGYLHGVAGGGLVAHDADVLRLRPDEFDAVVIANVHKGSVLRQETVALQAAAGVDIVRSR